MSISYIIPYNIFEEIKFIFKAGIHHLHVKEEHEHSKQRCYLWMQITRLNSSFIIFATLRRVSLGQYSQGSPGWMYMSPNTISSCFVLFEEKRAKIIICFMHKQHPSNHSHWYNCKLDLYKYSFNSWGVELQVVQCWPNKLYELTKSAASLYFNLHYLCFLESDEPRAKNVCTSFVYSTLINEPSIHLI